MSVFSYGFRVLVLLATTAQPGLAAGAGETSSVQARLSSDVDALVSHIDNADFSSVIGSVASSMHFDVVALPVLDSTDADRVMEALAQRSREIAHMRAVLGASTRASNALAAAGFAADQVVWIAGEGEYMMHLYAIDR